MKLSVRSDADVQDINNYISITDESLTDMACICPTDRRASLSIRPRVDTLRNDINRNKKSDELDWLNVCCNVVVVRFERQE